MKEAEDYLFNDQVFGSGAEGHYRLDVVKMIERAQKDAYNQAIDDAANNADIGYEFETKLTPCCFECGHTGVDKQTILKLKKK